MCERDKEPNRVRWSYRNRYYINMLGRNIRRGLSRMTGAHSYPHLIDKLSHCSLLWDYSGYDYGFLQGLAP